MVGKSGESADCVQMQAIVASRPRSADFRVSIQQQRTNSAPGERGADSEARCARADDQHLGVRRGDTAPR
jgi:hypothetical protein